MIRTLKNFYHLLVAMVACAFYRFPSNAVRVIGVTGTDGKTTTTSLIYHILTSAGKKASMVSTVYAKVGKREYDTGFHVSTPHSFVVQKFLRKSADNKDDFFIMETTSHALDQNRVFGVRYETAVITNITREHLDYHKTYENYVHAKAKLLQNATYKVVNADDESYRLLKEYLKDVNNVITYGLEKGDVTFDVSEKIGQPLAHFNKYNYLAAYIACKQAGLTDAEIWKGMKSFKLPPGRMEIITDKPFTVIVDFAHTPNSIKEALHTINDMYVKGSSRLIHVFGCAAKRDIYKRPVMGAESGKVSDLVILTEEDYREEDPYGIASEIISGLIKEGFTESLPEVFGKQKKTYTVIIDRKTAVEKALSIAKPGDVIVFTGKGHEKSLCRGKVEYPWDEQKTIRTVLKSLKHV